MSLYCTLCERKVDPVKKPWSWMFFFLWFLLLGVGALVYMFYHFVLKGTKYCPICWTKKLIKHSPEEQAAINEKKEINREARKEKLEGFVNAVKGE